MTFPPLKEKTGSENTFRESSKSNRKGTPVLDLRKIRDSPASFFFFFFAFVLREKLVQLTVFKKSLHVSSNVAAGFHPSFPN